MWKAVEWAVLSTGKCVTSFLLASFPGCSRLQFLITCNMQKRRAKAWEKESRGWRQVDVRVDMRGAVTNRCNSQTLRWSASSLPDSKLYWHCLLNVTVSSSWTRRTLRFLVGHRPPHVYPHVYLTSRTWLFLLTIKYASYLGFYE